MSHKVSREKGACPPTVDQLLQQLEEAQRQHLADKKLLTAEFTAATQELEDLNKELQKEK